jgi:hypothetical protein
MTKACDPPGVAPPTGPGTGAAVADQHWGSASWRHSPPARKIEILFGPITQTIRGRPPAPREMFGIHDSRQMDTQLRGGPWMSSVAAISTKGDVRSNPLASYGGP